jgi:NADH-quinone oxidoreductase subunit N
MWTPDVYHGSPSAVTAFMSVGAKAGGFAALLRIFVSAFPALSTDLTMIIWVIAALTMFLGNVVAIAQSNIKRMLAYSSIAHAGYILMALVPYGNSAVNSDTISAALFYLVAYALTSFGAWAVVIALEKAEGKGLELNVMLVSQNAALAPYGGIHAPLSASTCNRFMGKFYLFRTVIEGGYLGLALIGVFTSLISAYYYLRVIVIMYMREGEPEARSEFWVQFTAAVTAILIIVLTLAAQPLLDLASKAVMLTFLGSNIIIPFKHSTRYNSDRVFIFFGCGVHRI